MSCQQVPTTPAFNPYPRSVQVGEFEVAIGGGIWVAIRAQVSLITGPGQTRAYQQQPCHEQQEKNRLGMRRPDLYQS